KNRRTICPRDARQVAGIGLRTVVDREHAARPDGDPERPERRVHHVITDGDEPFSLRARDQMLAGLVDEWFDGVHRTASFTFFIASATRERAASSVHPSVSATSAYERPSTLRSTNAARCPVGRARTAFLRSMSVTPSRSGAARRRSASATARRDRRARSIALFVAIR